MKILFNTMGLGKGGAERVINLLSNSFVQSNEVVIVTNINSKVEYKFDERIKIIPLCKDNNTILRKIRRISISMIYKLKKLIVNYKPDIIISFLPEPSFRVLLLKKYCKEIKNIPVIVSVRNDPNTEYSNPIFFYIMKKLYPYSDQLVLQTQDAKEYFMDKINYNGVVIANPVSNTFLVERFKGIREKRIVAVGRLEPQKNYKNMIDAFELVIKNNREYEFNIYGDGYLKEEIQEYIDSKRIGDRVILKGKVDNIKDEIYKSSIFVMSSDYEGMPNSLLEAVCLGIPCVSTNCPCGGPKEILENGKNGILVDVKNSEELANGILHLIKNPGLMEKFSINGNDSARKYSEDKIIKIWNSEINKLIKEY